METVCARFEAIGTRWEIQIYQSIEQAQWKELLASIRGRIEAFDKAYSRFRNDSLITQMSTKAGKYALPADGYKMLTFYEQLYRATNGNVTPLIGQTISDAGYNAAYSFISKSPQKPPAWDDVIRYDKHTLTLSRPAMLDFGAAGKGYLVDIISSLIAKAGITSYLINAGGDILHYSAHTSEIALENPFDTSEAIGIVQLGNQSLCASAGSKRKWSNFHHIIDPHTVQSPDKIAATWVIADDTMTADGVATALFFESPLALQKHFSFSYAILYADMSLEHSQDFPVKVFSMEPT
jgi:FAD:protein FMN transferase